MTVAGTYCYKNMTNLNDGTYQFKVYANDTSDNWNATESRQVTLDTTPPTLTFVSPTPNNGVFPRLDLYKCISRRKPFHMPVRLV